MPRDTNKDLVPPQPMNRRKRLELAIKGHADGDMMLHVSTIRALLRAVDYYEQDAAELIHQNAPTMTTEDPITNNSPCPNCGEHDLWRESVDVGVGVIFGPYGCESCGWSEDPHYDRSNSKTPPGASDYPGRYVDQWGVAWYTGSKPDESEHQP